MKSANLSFQLLMLALFVVHADRVSADVIDPFTESQGPITLGPGEEPAAQDVLVETFGVLGGMRVALPQVDDTAEAGSTATMQIAGGAFDCRVDFPSPGNTDNAGGCLSSYFRGAGPVFDLTGSSRFLFDVQSVEGVMDLVILLVDTNEGGSIGYIENISAGQASVPFVELLPMTAPSGVDLSLVDGIFFVVLNVDGQDGRIVLNGFSTDGPIADGPVLPINYEIVAEETPGTYFNANRDGEGCQLTLERDQVTFILTCYFYNQGEQFWVIGAGEMVNGQVEFGEMTITSGAQYGEAFEPDDVVRSNWGSAIMTWSDCNNAGLVLRPIVPGYQNLTLNLTRVVPTVCGDGEQGDFRHWMGAFFDPDRDGEGFHFGVEAGDVFVMTWYTYLNGRQVWMIGVGEKDGQRVVFDNMIITAGAGFGSQFDPADVVRESFGEIIVDFTDCNHFTATVNTQMPEFHNLELNVTKVVPGVCP